MLYEDIGVETFVTSTPGSPADGFMDKCSDFIVVESSVIHPQDYGNFHAYYLIKSGVSTEKARRKLSGIGYRGGFFYYGLKDSNSLSVQRIALSSFVGKELCIEGKIKLAYIGRTPFVPKRGGFEGNIFAIRIPRSQANIETLEELKKIPFIPNFYGHQRFGTKKPLNHEIAAEKLMKGDLDLRGFEGRLLAESLQSYIFNRCLSRLKLEENIGKAGLLLGKGHEKLSKKEIASKEHYECSLEVSKELGVLELMSSRDFLKSSMRLLYIENPLLRYYSNDERIVVLLKMPPGSYASIFIREFFKQDESWIYKKCLPEKVC